MATQELLQSRCGTLACTTEFVYVKDLCNRFSIYVYDHVILKRGGGYLYLLGWRDPEVLVMRALS